MTAEHRARMLEHLTSVKAALDAHEPPEEGQMMIEKNEGPMPGTVSTAGFEGVLLQSASIGALALALSKAQGEIKAPKKGRTGKIQGVAKTSGKAYEYEYSYADLADVIECYRGPLSKNGLAVLQPIIQRDGHLVLVTKLLHASGEWLQSEYPLVIFDRPQEQGSAITYARRYTVSSLLGIAAEDDDEGGAAQDGTPAPRPAQQAISRPQTSSPPAAHASRDGKPACPKCGNQSAVIDNSYKPGTWLCWTKAKRGTPGCGHKFGPDDFGPPNLPSDYPSDFQVSDEEIPF